MSSLDQRSEKCPCCGGEVRVERIEKNYRVYKCVRCGLSENRAV
jgi:predicted RNA-binding Zn-ribbon protein involved in translation (DUF1610 family)